MRIRACLLGFYLVALSLVVGCGGVRRLDAAPPDDEKGSSSGGGGADAEAPELPACLATPFESTFASASADVRSLQAVADLECNVLFAGMVWGALDLGQGPLGDATTSFSIFLAKLDPSGKLLWAKRLPPGAYLSEGVELAVDAEGSAVLGGLLEGDVDFGDGVLPVDGAGSEDELFVAKFDHDGGLVFSKRIGGDTVGEIYTDRRIQAVDVDADGNILVAGDFEGTLELGGGFEPQGGGMFVAKLDPLGHELWARQLGTQYGGDQSGGAAFFDGGSVAFAAACGPGADLGAGSLSSDAASICFAAYTADGTFLCQQSFAGAFNSLVGALGALPGGGFFLMGLSAGDIDLGGRILDANDAVHGFAIELGPDGTPRWGRMPVDGLTSGYLGGVATDEARFVAGFREDCSAGCFHHDVLAFDGSGNAVELAPGLAPEDAESIRVGVDRSRHLLVSSFRVPMPETAEIHLVRR